MPYCDYNGHRVYYELAAKPGAPTVAIVNGLTQATRHWAAYRERLNELGCQVLTFDLLGQGASSKPVLDLDFDDNVDALAGLLDHLGIERAYVAGISFGGIVVLKFGIRHPQRTAGLVPMSTFSEMDAQLHTIGANLYQGMARVGFEYLVDLFTSYNFSGSWLERNADRLPELRRLSSGTNDLYAIQNLMESISRFEGFTDQLDRIQAPALIMNGEYDALTPRACHENLRRHIRSSRLLLLQHVAHAFTLEIPEICCRLLADFVAQVESGRWQGDQSVWIASDDAEAAELMFPCRGDHTRAIPV